MVLKRQDIKAILESLMGTEMSDEEFQLDEIAMSAVCEVMNQMMGSAATALADFLGRTVNISTPIAFEITDVEDFKGRYFQETENIVQVRFDLKMGDVINSQFLNVLSVPLAKEMVSLFLAGTGLGGDNEAPEKELVDISEDLNKAEEEAKTEAPQPQQVNTAPAPAPQPTPEPKVETPAPQPTPEPKVEVAPAPQPQQVNTAPASTPQPAPAPQPVTAAPTPAPQPAAAPRYEEDRYDDNREREMRERRRQDRMSRRNAEPVNVAPMAYESFDDEMEELTSEERTNLGLILSVPLQVSVEIGRTSKKIKDILDFTQGTIVELDKQAGSQVDIIINGQVIAKGDVVVVNDNFGVRVTEIVKKEEIVKLTL